jgi:3-oxoacyl-[acyl-carrier protein] reductase
MGFLEDRAGLAGKVALVTGGGGGLGAAIALDFARAGVDLALCDRDEPALERTVAEARETGVTVISEVFDVREPEALRRFFEALDETFGRIDILVNVVGGTFRADFVTTNPKGWDTLIRTNFLHVLHATQMAAVRMQAAGRGGSIINLTSIEAHRAVPGFAVYGAMKAGIASLARSLALELGPDGIRVNNIAPDITPTEGMTGIRALDGTSVDLPTGDDARTALGDRVAIPMARKGKLSDVGNCALFLASDLSSYVTGTTLHPDGGAMASAGWFNWPGEGYRNTLPDAVLDDLYNATGSP